MSRTGNRLALPAQADKVCASCGAKRGNVRKGWAQITRADQVVGWTCPECPRSDEPIRRTITGRGAVRFRVVVDATPAGASKRRQVTRTVDTLEDARQVVENVRAEVSASGAYSPTAPVTVSELIDRWLGSRDDVRQVTLEDYQAALVPVRRRLGDRPLASLTSQDVRDLKAWLTASGGRPTKAQPEGRPLSPRTVRGALIHFRAALNMAVADELISRNPAVGVKAPRQVRKRGKDVQHWTPAQLQQFRATADGHRLAAAWRLTLCGMTRADVLGLRWSDVDLEAGTVTVAQGRVQLTMNGQTTVTDEPKSEQRRRTVPVEQIHGGTVALLRRFKLATGGGGDESRLLVVDEAGQPLRPERYSDLFAELCEAAEVPRIRLHSVRHSLAFWLHDIKVAPAYAAALLGHTVDVYLGTYLPAGGAVGIDQAASALHAAQQVDGEGQATGTL